MMMPWLMMVMVFLISVEGRNSIHVITCRPPYSPSCIKLRPPIRPKLHQAANPKTRPRLRVSTTAGVRDCGCPRLRLSATAAVRDCGCPRLRHLPNYASIVRQCSSKKIFIACLRTGSAADVYAPRSWPSALIPSHFAGVRLAMLATTILPSCGPDTNNASQACATSKDHRI